MNIRMGLAKGFATEGFAFYYRRLPNLRAGGLNFIEYFEPIEFNPFRTAVSYMIQAVSDGSAPLIPHHLLG